MQSFAQHIHDLIMLGLDANPDSFIRPERIRIDGNQIFIGTETGVVEVTVSNEFNFMDARKAALAAKRSEV